MISYLKFSFVPQQHLMSTSNPIQRGSASSRLWHKCPALLICLSSGTLMLHVLSGSGILTPLEDNSSLLGQQQHSNFSFLSEKCKTTVKI